MTDHDLRIARAAAMRELAGACSACRADDATDRAMMARRIGAAVAQALLTDDCRVCGAPPGRCEPECGHHWP